MKVLNILLMSCFGGILIDIGACITGIKYSQSMEFMIGNITIGSMICLLCRDGEMAKLVYQLLTHWWEKWITLASCLIEEEWL